MVPSTREEFKERILQNLGHPILKINVTPEQIDNVIDDTLYRFFERHYMGIETGYYIVTPTAEDVQNGYMILPPDIAGVGELYRVNTDSNIYSVDFQLKMAELWGLSSVTFAGSLSYYYTVKMHLGLLTELFQPDRSYSYNYVTNKLVVYGLAELFQSGEGGMILKVFKKIQPSDGTPTNTNSVTGNIWQVLWLIEMATAKLKLQWGNNLSKYSGVQLLGGVTLDATAIKAEAKQEIIDLDNELQTVHNLPPMGWVG